MTKRTPVKDILKATEPMKEVIAKAWVRTKRESKAFSFIEINDGSCLANLQVVADQGIKGYELMKSISTGAAVYVKGEMVESPGKGQKWEIKATEIGLYGEAGNDFPLQKKGHTKEFLREIAHLRPRTNLFGATFRIRSRLAYAVHNFFQEQGFHYVHTPIVTASDCEGAGELFRVSTLDATNPPKSKETDTADFSQDFFGKQAYLTVSGQLEVETFATALSKVYTFGPTFRAENSNTPRHAAEFWMIEPEMAFADIEENMDVAESFVKHLVKETLEASADDLEIFTKFVDKSLKDRLQNILNNKFERLEYTKAIEILQNANKDFEYKAEYGADLQTEHERYLTEEHFKKPVFVYNWPKEIKPFYMKSNDDNKTVGAMDLLVPQIGELIGGSQREDDYETLKENLKAHGIPEEDYYWYLDLRKWGSVPHSGFGLGFERMIMLVTGLSNIRDVIPFPRTPKNCEF